MSIPTRIWVWIVGMILCPPLILVPLYRWYNGDRPLLWWPFSESVSRNPFQIGRYHHEAGRFDEAFYALQQVPAGDEHYVRAQLLAGDSLIRQTDLKTAAEVLKRATLKGNKPTAEEEKEGRYLLGRCYQDLGQSGAAEQEFRKVYSVDSRYRDVAQRLREVTT